MSVSITPAEHQRLTAHALVHTTLRTAIVSGRLAGGTRLVQAEIARELSVSTTPVREALRDLATEGLIELDAHRGATVRTLDANAARDIYELRLLIEPEAMRRVARTATGDTLRAAAELHARMSADGDPTTWSELNHTFHASLTGILNAPRMASTIRGLQDAAAPFVALALGPRPGELIGANHEHAALLEALQARDEDLAAEVTAAHLHRTLRILVELIEGDGVVATQSGPSDAHDTPTPRGPDGHA